MNTLKIEILVFVLFFANTFSQDSVDVGNKIDLNQHAKVTLMNKAYQFNYLLQNGSKAKQEIEEFTLHCIAGIDVYQMTSANNWDGLFFSQTESLIRWIAAVNDTGDGYINAIKPNVTLAGYSFISNNLPGIVIYYAEGNHSVPTFPDGMATDIIPGYSDLTPYGPGVIGKTIGPVTIPDPFAPLDFLDTLSSYTTQSRALGWIKDDATANKYLNYFASAKAVFQLGILDSVNQILKTVLLNAISDSTNNLTSEAYALLYYNAAYLISQIPTSGCIVKLTNSTGVALLTGYLQYYESGAWKDAVNNNNGIFRVNTTHKKVSLRMTYEYGTQTKTNVTIKNDSTIIFQTKNVSVNLQNSQGNPLDIGVVQYNVASPYGAWWQDFGTTTNGIITKELLPIKYTFRLTYNGVTVSKTQNVDSNAIVVFQTIPTTVQLQTSNGIPLDTGIIQYYAGGWQTFGTTSNGAVAKELLPLKYTFRLTYDGTTISKSQNIDSNATIVFRTIPATVQFKTSTGVSLDTGIVQYYASAWKDFGTTVNGAVTKELLPAKYSFRLTYQSSTISKAQNIDSLPTIVFQTTPAKVQLQTSSGLALDTAIVQYYSGGWRTMGSTSNGVISTELLPIKYSFRLTVQWHNC